MKKLLITNILLLILSSCTVKIHTKSSRCQEILNQRSYLLGSPSTKENMFLLKQTDSLYIKSGCDTIK